MPEFGGDRMWGLKEMAMPEPISWFPATPGWLVLLAIALMLLGWLGWRRVRAWRRERYRREALARIDALRAAPDRLAELPIVLRATALTAFPREEVASLRGSAWVSWLNENGGRFEPADAECLDRLPYDGRTAASLAPEASARLLAASRAWVKGHHARL